MVVIPTPLILYLHSDHFINRVYKEKITIKQNSSLICKSIFKMCFTKTCLIISSIIRFSTLDILFFFKYADFVCGFSE